MFRSLKDKNCRTVDFHGQMLELQVTVQRRTKVYELRYSVYGIILLMEQSLCFPKLWWLDAFFLDWKWRHMEKGIWAALDMSSLDKWTRHTAQPAPWVCSLLPGSWNWLLKMDGQSTQAAALVVFHDSIGIPFGNHWTMLIHLTSTMLQWEKT